MISPMLGIEFHFIHEAEALQQWPLLIDCLVQNNLCSFEKKEALQSWTGARGIPCKPLEPFMLWRKLNHIKLTYEVNTPLTAKGYLWFGPGPSPMQWLQQMRR